MTDEKITPCPFCESEHVGVRSRVSRALNPECKYFLFVQCADCGARGAGFPFASLDEFLPDDYNRSIKPPSHQEREYNVYRELTREFAILVWNDCVR